MESDSPILIYRQQQSSEIDLLIDRFIALEYFATTQPPWLGLYRCALLIERVRKWIFSDGAPVPKGEYYLRTSTTFEVQSGKHDWLTRHVMIGLGKRKQHGNKLRYYIVL